MSDLPPDHQVGANNPPDEATVYRGRLEGDTEDLLDAEMELELALGKVPKEVESDGDQAKVNAWVVKMRQLARDLEGRRVKAKEPYLQRGKWIDEFFGDVRARVLEKAKAVEQRSTAYLQAKKRREEEEARAKAEAAAAERRRQEEEAARARLAEQRAREELERKEREVAAAARRSAEEAEKAERELRAATQAAALAAREVEKADTSVRQAELAEDRAERRAADPTKLGKTTAGGASAKVVMVPRFRIDNVSLLIQSTGPINPYLSIDVLKDALERWAKVAQGRPSERGVIPGVVWWEEAETKTTAARGPR